MYKVGGVLLDYCLILWYNFGIFDEVRGIFMTEDKKKNYEELKEVAYNLADEAVPVDKTYSEIVEESALEFIYEQYDEKQREEILASIERGRDGSISWKGENGDYIKLKFENGELVRGVLKDRDENGVYQKIKFKVKEDGYVYENFTYRVSGNTLLMSEYGYEGSAVIKQLTASSLVLYEEEYDEEYDCMIQATIYFERYE